MKKLTILIATVAISMSLASCGRNNTTAPQTNNTEIPTDQTQTIQFYKDSVTQLQNELAAFKEEAYIMSTTYELKIRELEEYIESMKSQNDFSEGDKNSPNQNIVEENHKAHFEYSLTADGAVITKYIGNLQNVEIPSSINGRPVRKILEYAFSETNVKSVVLPDSVTELDWFAFYKCPFLEKVYVPTSVTSIGYGAFDYCAGSLTIYGEADSYAQRYAQSFGIDFKAS